MKAGDGAAKRGSLFWTTAAAGWALIGWGIRGALHHNIDTRPTQLARFFVDGIVAHDLIFAPLVLAAGVAVTRATPGRWRATVQAASVLAGVVLLFAYPEIRGYAHVLHNPTSLPHDYAANAAVVAVAVVGIAGAAGGARVRARRHDPADRRSSSLR